MKFQLNTAPPLEHLSGCLQWQQLKGQFWEPLDEGLAVGSHWSAVFEKLDLLANKFTQAFYERNWSGEFRSEERRVGKECTSRCSPDH